MSKSFAQAPKPPQLTAETIAAFERGGSGQDTKTRIPPKVESREPTNVETFPPTPPPSPASEMATTDVEKSEPTNVGKRVTTNPDKPEPTRRLSIDLPESWHRRFKTACTKSDKKMIDEVTDFIKRRTAQLEKE
jgi:hypothetical protein